MKQIGEIEMLIAKYKIGDKVKRSTFIASSFGAEFYGGKEIEEIIKVEMPTDEVGVIKYWLSNGRWCSDNMIQLAEGTNNTKEEKQ